MKKIEELVNQIHLGKWEEVMPQIPDNSVDIVITSPPYNVSLGIDNKFKKDAYDNYDDNMPYDKYLDWMEKCFTECYRVLKRGGRACLDGETLISTKRGLIPIKDVVVGDEVLTHRGKWKKVIELTKSYHQEHYVLQVENSQTVKITGNHPVFSAKTQICPYRTGGYVCRDNCPHKDNAWRKDYTTIKCKKLFYKEYQSQFISVQDLSAGDMVLMPIPRYFNGTNRISKKMSYIIGMYLAEGWCTKKYRINKNKEKKYKATALRFAHHIKEFSIYDKLKKYIKEEKGIKNGKDYIKGKGLTTSFYNTEFAKYMETFGCGSINKNIPFEVYLNTNVKDLLQIVVAFWYGDGSIVKIKNNKDGFYGNVVSMTTISPLLALQIRDILYVNGFCPKIVTRKRTNLNHKTAFNIILCGNDAREFYSISKKFYNIDMYKYNNKNKGKSKAYRFSFGGYVSYQIKKYKKVQNDSIKQYYNLEVEDDQSYCLSGFAVHNCINIGDRKQSKDVTHVDFIVRMRKIGLLMLCPIVWDKRQIGNRTAWGSYKSPAMPCFPTPFEYIIVMCKEDLRHEGDPQKISVTAKEFQTNANALWSFPPDTRMKEKYDHPATFPEELPRRLIQQLTYEDDIVLDPFSGAGTTCAVAKKLRRKYIGIEMSEKYHATSLRRIGEIAVTTRQIDEKGKETVIADWMK